MYLVWEVDPLLKRERINVISRPSAETVILASGVFDCSVYAPRYLLARKEIEAYMVKGLSACYWSRSIQIITYG